MDSHHAFVALGPAQGYLEWLTMYFYVFLARTLAMTFVACDLFAHHDFDFDFDCGCD